MNTPICDFVKAYQKSHPLRLHMPGHKGEGFLGVEGLDLTEIAGADVLYRPRGIIRESENNAAELFGAGRTVYSAEGSSLCIRAMLYLALLRAREKGDRPVILAGRNAHQTLVNAAALLDLEIRWLYGVDLISCPVDGPAVCRALEDLPGPPAAVYVTSPDYLGHTVDIAGIASVCRGRNVPLLVDNAHGAYLKFLPEDRHPLALGADMVCDSAHKTLPVLTGGAYLHIGENAPALFGDQADRAMALFASTSPSYLILQSLDACNAYLAGDYPAHLAALAERAAGMKERLAAHGYALIGDEPAKLTVAPKAYGYTGDALHDELRKRKMECEFSDPDFLTAMLTPALPLDRLEDALLSIPSRAPIPEAPPPLPRPARALSLRAAMLAPAEEIPAERAEGRILADAQVSCPPCIPILVGGERIDGQAVRCFRYYGMKTVRAVVEREDGSDGAAAAGHPG